jgi:hypothetical protein
MAYGPWYDWGNARLLVLTVHLIVTLVRLTKPGGLRSLLAESVLIRHQLLILDLAMFT